MSEVALFGKNPEIEISHVQSKEITLVGSNMYTRCDFEVAAQTLAANLFDTALFLSKVFPIHQAKEAMELVDRKKEAVVKVLLSYA